MSPALLSLVGADLQHLAHIYEVAIPQSLSLGGSHQTVGLEHCVQGRKQRESTWVVPWIGL